MSTPPHNPFFELVAELSSLRDKHERWTVSRELEKVGRTKYGVIPHYKLLIFVFKMVETVT